MPLQTPEPVQNITRQTKSNPFRIKRWAGWGVGVSVLKKMSCPSNIYHNSIIYKSCGTYCL